MSGGFFDYAQYNIKNIANSLNDELLDIDSTDTSCTLELLRESDASTINSIKFGISLLHLAAIYTHRIDWYLSGDDSEKSFRSRLVQDLDEFSKTEIGKRFDLSVNNRSQNG